MDIFPAFEALTKENFQFPHASFVSIQRDYGVGVVGVQLTKFSLEVMREYGRHGEPCN